MGRVVFLPVLACSMIESIDNFNEEISEAKLVYYDGTQVTLIGINLWNYSQQHLAAAQQAVQPIQAAQPAPAPAMQPVQPQYDYSAYAGYAHAQQAAAVPAAAAAAAAAAVAHQPSPIPAAAGYNAYGQPLQAAAPAQPIPTNGYHQPQPAVSAYQQYDQSAYAGYAAYQWTSPSVNLFVDSF